MTRLFAISRNFLSRHLFAGLFVWAFLWLVFMHRQSCTACLRYTRVAEGNISQTAAGFWAKGLQALKTTLNDDACAWGRIRPAHHLYYQLPFVVTLFRNGDIYGVRSGKDVAARINGDLQTHTLVLLATLAVGMAGAAYTLLTITGSWWGVLFFITCFGGSLTIGENLLVNYCDSGEIPQLAWLGLYGATLTVAWRSEGRKRIVAESGAVFFLFMAFATKETSVVLLPLAVILSAFLFWRNNQMTAVQRRFVVRQLLWHVALAATLLLIVAHVKSGAYVAANYSPAQVDFSNQIRFASSSLCKGFDGLRLGALSLVLLGAIVLLRSPGVLGQDQRFVSGCLLALVVIGAGLAFLIINLPWQAILTKYFIVTFFFLALGFAAIQTVITRSFTCHGLRWAGLVWMLAVLFFLIKETGNARARISDYYRDQYGYRAGVPLIARDLAAATQVPPRKNIQALIIAGDLYQEGVLPFLRQANLLCGRNIRVGNSVVDHVDACERNYFHTMPAAGSICLALHARLPEAVASEVTVVYAYRQFIGEKEDQQLRAMGFGPAKDLLSGQNVHILKYCRSSVFEGGGGG